jgi:UDP-N-acetylglucosamine 4-epimerase
MADYDEVRSILRARPRRFLVTGAAGFIGSHLLEGLLRLGQHVVGLDNLATGSRRNLTDAIASAGPEAIRRFHFIEGDIRDPAACARATEGVDVVLHQAALASVPKSIEDPLSFHSVNVVGSSNVLGAAHAAGVKRVVFASSSSVYGDDPSQTKSEERIGKPLSPYAETKRVGEVRAAEFGRSRSMITAGLRYFNVFGPRQNPQGPYAAVVPRWIENLLHGDPCVVFGDGTASRDFCFVDNVVQANLLAACAPDAALEHAVFNVACGERTTLIELFDFIRQAVSVYRADAKARSLRFDPPRVGDIRHSLASIERARDALGYEPVYDVWSGLSKTVAWYALRNVRAAQTEAHGTTYA